MACSVIASRPCWMLSSNSRGTRRQQVADAFRAVQTARSPTLPQLVVTVLDAPSSLIQMPSKVAPAKVWNRSWLWRSLLRRWLGDLDQHALVGLGKLGGPLLDLAFEAFLRLGNGFGHRVEGSGQRPDFVVAGVVASCGDVAGGHLPGRVRQFLEGAQAVANQADHHAHNDQREEDRDEERAGGDFAAAIVGQGHGNADAKLAPRLSIHENRRAKLPERMPILVLHRQVARLAAEDPFRTDRCRKGRPWSWTSRRRYAPE